MKKIKLITTLKLAIVLLCFSASLSSCNKDGSSEPDDPNIVYTTFNKTLTSSIGVIVTDSLDFNLDTKTDFKILSGFTASGDTAAAYLLGVNGGSYIDSTLNYSSVYQTVALSSGQAPMAHSTAKQWSIIGAVALKRGSGNIWGFAGAGDKFIPLSFNNILTGKYHYGWVRVNVSSDYTTFKIIDGAYNLVPETPIKMGAK